MAMHPRQDLPPVRPAPEGQCPAPADALPGAARVGAAPRFNPNVHGARGLFALLVLVFHVANSGLRTIPALQGGPGEAVLRSAEYGVELFFCISGFVIVGSLSQRRSVVAFLRDRAIRILPVLWTTFLVIVPLVWLAHRPGENLPPRMLAWLLPANMALLPGALPLRAIHPAAWSLSYEAMFYLVCAAAWMLHRRAGRGAALAFAVPAAAILVCLYPRGLFFVSGALALGEGGRVLRRLSRHPLAWLALFLAAWQAIQRASPAHINEATLWNWTGDARLALALLAFVAATIGFRGLVAGHGSLGRLLRSAPMQGLGTISYSLYLWHPVVMGVAKQAMRATGAVAATGQGAQAALLVLALPPSIALATVSQRLVERRFGHWLHARTGRSPRQLAVDPPGAGSPAR